MLRATVWLAACAPLFVGGAALAHPHKGRQPPGAQAQTGRTDSNRAESESEPAGRWTTVVVKLGYARAEDVALLLSQLAPPGVTVTAYEPTNSLIIAGDPAVLSKLTNEAKTGETQKGR